MPWVRKSKVSKRHRFVYISIFLLFFTLLLILFWLGSEGPFEIYSPFIRMKAWATGSTKEVDELNKVNLLARQEPKELAGAQKGRFRLFLEYLGFNPWAKPVEFSRELKRENTEEQAPVPVLQE